MGGITTMFSSALPLPVLHLQGGEFQALATLWAASKTVASGGKVGREAQLYEEYSKHHRPTVQRAVVFFEARTLISKPLQRQ